MLCVLVYWHFREVIEHAGFPRGVQEHPLAIHTFEVVGLPLLVLEGGQGTCASALVYSPIGCKDTSIAVLKPVPQVLQFGARLTDLASLLPKIPLRLLGR